MAVMCRTLSDLVARGCLPVGVSARDSVVFAPIAELSRPNPCFLEPRFSDAVAAYRRGQFYAVPVAGFAEQAGQLDGVPVAGIIAHTSRCGSTWLANLLALRATNLVLKEPIFLIQAVSRLIRARQGRHRHAAAALVRGLLRYLGAVAHAHSRRLVIKLTSWTTPVLTQLIPVHESHRWLLLYREPPVEVVASLMATPPQWWRSMRARTDVITVLRATGSDPALSGADPAEVYARVWHAVVAPFSSPSTFGYPPSFGVVDYASLCEDPVAVFREVHVGLGLGEVDKLPAGFAEIRSRYSKGAVPVLFDPAGTHRRPPLSRDDQATVRRITDASFRRIRALRDDAG
jgi:hypothetical protein